MNDKRDSSAEESPTLERRRFLKSLAAGGGVVVAGSTLGGCRTWQCFFDDDPDRLCISDFSGALRNIQKSASPGAISAAWKPAIAELQPTGRVAVVATLEMAQNWDDASVKLADMRRISQYVAKHQLVGLGGGICGAGCGSGCGLICGLFCGVFNPGDDVILIGGVDYRPEIFTFDVEGQVLTEQDLAMADRQALPRAMRNAARAYERIFA